MPRVCSLVRTVMAILMLATLACCQGDPSALLRVAGHVTVDDVQVVNSGLVFGGETISTAGQSTAMMTMAGTLVTIHPHSKVMFDNLRELNLFDGNVYVTTFKKYRTTIGSCGDIEPTSGLAGGQDPVDQSRSQTSYEVTLFQGRAYIYARQKSVWIRSSSRRIKLRPEQVAIVEHPFAVNCKVAINSSLDSASIPLNVKTMLFSMGPALAGTSPLWVNGSIHSKQPLSSESP